MMFVSLISYIDRNTLALLAPSILRECHLSGEQYGFIISGFSIAYMIGNPLWGIALDRIGIRLGMTIAVTFWTIASTAHALAGGFWSFALARTLLGFGEGATFPGGLRTAVQSLPAEQRSRGIAVAYSGGSLGAVITPLLVTPIAVAFGWRGAFWFTGIVGCVWLLFWQRLSQPLHVPPSRAQAVTRPRVSDPKLWAFMAVYSFGGLPLAFVIYGAALFLAQDRSLSQVTLGKILWIPPLGWEVGYFFWGWLSDRLRARGSARYAFLLRLATLASIPLAFTASIPSLPVVMFELFFAMFAASGFVIVSIAYASEVLPPQNAGLIAGLGAGSWSGVVALVMPLFGHLFDQHRYGQAFGIAAAFPLAGFFLWRLLAKETVISTEVRSAQII
jgi:ACS family hexuronate transporter-like MFS transporter